MNSGTRNGFPGYRRIILILAMFTSVIAWTICWASIDMVVLFNSGPNPSDSSIAHYIVQHTPYWPRWIGSLAFYCALPISFFTIWWEWSTSGSITRAAMSAILPAGIASIIPLIEHRQVGYEIYLIGIASWVVFAFALSALLNRFANHAIRSPKGAHS